LDWGAIGTTLALLYGTLILVTIAPAVQTARLPPAQALRLQE
jgi:ABC-type lipoprotein release transport system permease subunit